MTQEEKRLLLKDLCGRLPYGVICHIEKGDGHLCSINQTIFGTEYGLKISPLKRDYFDDSEQDEVVIKPYLRPMSSMADEEKENLQSLHDIISDENYGDGYSPSAWDAIAEWEDYCNSRHLDYRGLIEIGLALEAPEGMYKTE